MVWGAFNCCFLPDDWKTPLDNLFQNSISNMLPEDGVFSNSDCFPCWSVCRRTMYLVIIPPHPFPSRLKWFKLASCWNAALKLAHYRHCNCSAWLILLCSLSHWCTFCPTVRTCEDMLESTLKRSSPIATIHKSKRLKAAKMNECGFSCGYGAHVGVTSLRWGFSSIPWWLSAYGVMNCSAGLWKFERMVKPFGTAEASYQIFFLFFSTSYLVQCVGGKEPWSICHVSGCKVDIRGDADVQICMN